MDVEKEKETILAKEKDKEKVVIKITTKTTAKITMIGEEIGTKTAMHSRTPKARAQQPPHAGLGTPGMQRGWGGRPWPCKFLPVADRRGEGHKSSI